MTPSLNPVHICKRVSHICEACKNIIHKEQQYTSRKIQTGYGYPEGPHYTTLYKHYPACPKEAP